MEQKIGTQRRELDHCLEKQQIVNKSGKTDAKGAKDHGLRRKIKLKKLSLFYAGERDLSFDEEDDRDVGENPEHVLGSKSQYRLQRLSDLTNKINQWDEDNNYDKKGISCVGSKTKNRGLKLLPEGQKGGNSILSDRDRIDEDDERNYCCVEAAAGNDGTKRLFPSLRNIETDVHHSPDKVTNISIKCLREASINKLMWECENLIESSDYSSADEDDRSEVYFSPAKLIKSSSFEYISNELQNPLLYTVSFYRKQQQQRQVLSKEEKEDAKNNEDLGSSLEEKVQKLLAEVDRQGVIRTQASQALHWCFSNAKFYGGEEQVEGERLLLLADHKLQACLNEIKRLKSEYVREPGEKNLISKRGFITASDISIKLRKDAFQSMADRPLHFVCLMKSGDCVLATPPVSSTRINLLNFSLLFPGSLNLETSFNNDSTITIEIYCLNLNEKFFIDDSKYEKKENKFLSPAKKNKFDMGWPSRNVQSSIIARTTNFSISGSLTFALKETNQTHWNLDPLPPKSPLEGTISMCLSSRMCFDTEFRAFLTVFDDISGFGVWHRRWCLLSTYYMLFWKYPDDEQSKVPLGMIDLRTVFTKNIGRVPFDVCARPNTFLLQSMRPFLKEDKNSLILRIEEDVTTIRYLLSADSKPEMLSWCRRLNAVLDLLRKDANYTIHHT